MASMRHLHPARVDPAPERGEPDTPVYATGDVEAYMTADGRTAVDTSAGFGGVAMLTADARHALIELLISFEADDNVRHLEAVR